MLKREEVARERRQASRSARSSSSTLSAQESSLFAETPTVDAEMLHLNKHLSSDVPMKDDTELVSESTYVPVSKMEVPSQFVADSLLGRGGQASVYSGHMEISQEEASLEDCCLGKAGSADLESPKIQLPVQAGNQPVALKVYEASNIQFFEQEVKTLAMMEGNPHFVRMLGAYESSSVLVSRKIPEDENDHFAKWRTGHQIQSSMHVIKMEICSNGDLFNVISSHGPLLEDSLLRFVFLQVCKGVHAMHSKAGHAHVDLKLENVLVGNDALIKLCDFGMAQPVEANISKQLGTKFYCSPEVLSADPFRTYKGVSADIFSLGVILFILAFGAPPFNMASLSDQNFRILTRNPDGFWKNHPNVRKSKRTIDTDLQSLLTSMLNNSISSRPESVEAVMSHPYFTKDEQLLDSLNNSWSCEDQLQMKFKSMLPERPRLED